MHRFSLRVGSLVAVSTLSLTLSACSGSAPTASDGDMPPSASTLNPAHSDGPLAATDRPLAPRQVSTNEAGTVQRADVDLGNVSDGKFSAPLRGQVYVPTQAGDSSPLIILSHLRAPNCTNMSFTYPCPQDKEFRYDRGMSYLGEHLASQGYTVLVPDLGGIFIGADVEAPYSQTRMWSEVIRTFTQAITTDSAGTTDLLGLSYASPVDTSTVGLFVHSRSGMLVDTAVQTLGKDALKGVFAYAPAYDTVELSQVSPAPADIPFLAVVGEHDSDVGASANLWLGHYADTPRVSSASVVEVPGLGHMYVNRAASATGFDDRVACDEVECASAQEHERVLMETATHWFDATLRGAQTDLPLHADQSLPEKVAGLAARWLALTPKAARFVAPGDFQAIEGSSVRVCENVDPMMPDPPAHACPEPASGVVQILTPVAHVATSAEASLGGFEGARGLALQISPSGTHEGGAPTPVTVSLALRGGEVWSVDVPGDHPALASRMTPVDNGTYRLGTIRLVLPHSVTQSAIESVRVTAKFPVEVRSVDVWK